LTKVADVDQKPSRSALLLMTSQRGLARVKVTSTQRRILGQAIRRVHDSSGLSYRAIEELVGVSWTHINRAANGHNRLTPELYAKVIKAFGGDLEEVRNSLRNELPPDVLNFFLPLAPGQENAAEFAAKDVALIRSPLGASA
jgi:hypothetical protein